MVASPIECVSRHTFGEPRSPPGCDHAGVPAPRTATVDLVIPVKPLRAAKTRLRGALGDDLAAHARLALALALDTIEVARSTSRVGRLLVVSTDPVVAAGLVAAGVTVEPDGPEPGLNAALRHGAGLLRGDGRARAVGALQADLPALRAVELDEAVSEALDAFTSAAARRAFCADADGTGTTLLLAAADADLDPRFGPGSAGRHRRSAALELTGRWPGLRRDVDTGSDLRAAADLGLGPRTRAVLGSGHPSERSGDRVHSDARRPPTRPTAAVRNNRCRG